MSTISEIHPKQSCPSYSMATPIPNSSKNILPKSKDFTNNYLDIKLDKFLFNSVKKSINWYLY